MLDNEPISVLMDKEVFEPKYEGKEIFNKGIIKATLIDERDTEDGRLFSVLFENMSEHHIKLITTDTTINGYMKESPRHENRLKSGHKVVRDFYVNEYFLEENEIESIETFVATLYAKDFRTGETLLPDSIIKIK